MIVNERIVSYMHSLEKNNSQVLEQIEIELIRTMCRLSEKKWKVS